MYRGELIRKYRKEKNLTQEQLAEKCNMATITIRQYENGKRTPQIEQLAVIAEKLDISVLELLEESEKNLFFQTQSINQLAEDLKERYSEFNQFVHEERGQAIIAAYYRLNDDGQTEAVKRVGELTRLTEYQRTGADQSKGGIVSPPDDKKPPEGQETPSDGK